MTFFTLLPLKQALSLSHRRYSFSTIARIACCTALTVEAVCIPLAFAWRLPAPFREMIGLPVWITSVCVYNYVFAARTMRCLWRRHHLQRYVPIVGVQVFLLYFLLGLSVWFSYLSILPQTVMVLTFPFIKLALKNLVWKYARELGDISTDVSICMLEVSGSLYQTVCLQFVTSPILSVLIMVSDIVQAIHEVRTYMKIDYEGDGRRTLVTAMAIVESAAQADDVGGGNHGMTIAMASTLQSARVVPSTVDEASEMADASDRATTVTHAAAVRARRLVASQADRGRRRSTRRLLDLDRVAANPDVLPRAGSECATDRHEDEPTDRVLPVATHDACTPVRSSQRVRSIPTEWLQRLLRRRPARAFRVYAVADDAAPLPRTGPKVEKNRPHRATVPLGSTAHHPAPPTRARSFGSHVQLRSIRIDGIQIPRRPQARVLEQTLQLLFVCEVLLFAEYMEVVIPVLYALVLGGEWLTPNAQYNVVVSVMTGEQAAQQVWTSLLYALLELASLFGMYYVMRRKYGVSAFYQLAFVLEKYWMTLTASWLVPSLSS